MNDTVSITLADIERACKAYSDESTKLNDLVSALDADLAKVKQDHIAGIKRQATVVARREAELAQHRDDAPDLFVKPRTVIMHGVKVGYTTSIGRIDYDDEAAVIRQIRAKLADRADELIRSEESLIKDALKRLTPAELARIGCRIDGAGNIGILKLVGGDIEKLIDKLIAKMVAGIIEDREAAQ
jgi:hypothetical protein